MPAKQVAILFADVRGFTKLHGAQVDSFVTNVMGALAHTLNDYDFLVKNTWGDAIFLLFDTANVAAECALKLRDTIRNTSWPDVGIYQDLEIRIALHNAHATIVTDPITNQPNAYGPHVNQAARLEPIVIPNEVFATENFKRALDAFGHTAYAWDEFGSVPLAKDWGISTVHRLRRPSEEAWNALKHRQTRKDPPSLEQLMPTAKALLSATGPQAAELTQLIAYSDNFLLGEGIIRRNWNIRVRYDTRQLRSKGIIVEHIQWSYELLNLRDTPTTYDLRLIGAPGLEGKSGLISWHKIDVQGREARLPLPSSSGVKGPMFEVRQNEISLDPHVLNIFELRVEQTWPVSRDNPKIHNTWAPRQVSFVNRLEVTGPIKKIGILFGDGELIAAFHRDTTYTYNIPSPILRDQAIEVLIDF